MFLKCLTPLQVSLLSMKGCHFTTTESNTTKLLDILQPTTEKDIFWEYENIVFQHAHRVSGL